MLPHAVVYGMPKVKRVTIEKDVDEKTGKKKFELNIEGNVLKDIFTLEEIDFT
jgi:hypothetical protein